MTRTALFLPTLAGLLIIASMAPLLSAPRAGYVTDIVLDNDPQAARLEEDEGDGSAAFLGWTSFNVEDTPLWTNMGSSAQLVVPAPDGATLTLNLSEHPAEPTVVVSIGTDGLPTDIRIFAVRAFTGSVVGETSSGAFLMLMDDGSVGGIVRISNWTAGIQNPTSGRASALEIGWTSVPSSSTSGDSNLQLVIEEPDFSHCGNVHVSKVRYDVEDGTVDANPAYYADLTEMHELSRLNWDDICIDLDMWQITTYDFNIIDSNACSTDDYLEFLDDDWGNPNIHTHQLWTRLDLSGCIAIAETSSLRDADWGASVVEGKDATILDYYSPYQPGDMSWVSTHELGHNHGVGNPEHYNACNTGGNVGCNLMYPSVPFDKGYWWTTGAKDQSRSYAYPRLD